MRFVGIGSPDEIDEERNLVRIWSSRRDPEYELGIPLCTVGVVR